MIKKDTIHAYADGAIKPKEASRKEKLLGSNCVAVELMSFVEDGKIVRVIVKKSRLGIERLEETREEYRKLRHHFGDIIPMQAFISEKCIEGSNRDLITAFCSPVSIAYDIFASDQNFEFLKEELKNNSELQHDLDLFILGYLRLKEEGFLVDLYGDENLVVTRDGRLKYIDSFVINFSGRKSLIGISESRFEKIKGLISRDLDPNLI